MRFHAFFRILSSAVLFCAIASLHAGHVIVCKVETRYKTTGDFKSICEFFTGKESKPDVLERTNPDVRDGMYFIVSLDWVEKGDLLLGTQFEIDYIRSDDTQPRKALFYLYNTRSTLPEMQFGLTGQDWPNKDVKVLAYKVTVRDPLGEILAEHASFLWNFPDEQRAKLLAEGRGGELPESKIKPEADLKRPLPPLPVAQAQTTSGEAAVVAAAKPQISPERLAAIQQSAQKGEIKGQIALGVLYLKGIGVEQNADKAVEYLKKAADAGSASADYNLGLMYAQGETTARNPELARSYFQKAAEKGNASAQYNLGHLYSYSGDIAPDGAAAVEWYTRAAKQGLAPAQYNLAFLLTRGDAGAGIDLPQAYYWAILAEKAKQAQAHALVLKLKPMLNSAQRQQAEDAAKAFKATPETAAAVAVEKEAPAKP